MIKFYKNTVAKIRRKGDEIVEDENSSVLKCFGIGALQGFVETLPIALALGAVCGIISYSTKSTKK